MNVLFSHLLLRLVFRASTIALFPWLLSTTLIQAKPSPAESIGPLEARSIDSASQGRGLEEAANTINAQTGDTQNPGPEPAGFDLRQLPLVGDLLNEEGNLEMGTNVPISVDFDGIGGGINVMVEERFNLK